MKKKYFSPETEIVYIKMNQTLLAGSPTDIKDDNVDDFNDLLAPGMDAPGELPGIPDILF